MATNPLTPLVDLARTFVLTEFDGNTGSGTCGTYIPVVAGTVTVYIASAPDSPTPADPSLSANAVYIGGVNSVPTGTWFWGLDAAILTFALLDSIFNVGTNPPVPYIVISRVSGIRAVEKLSYKRTLAATVLP